MRTQNILTPNFFFDQALRAPRVGAPADSHVEEKAEAYLIQIDIPGVPKEKVRISFENRLLVIEAERQGRSAAKLRRVFSLPDDVNADAIAAQVQDGVLELKLPKKEQAQPKQILVQDGKASFFGNSAELSG